MPGLRDPLNLELVGVVLVEEGDRNAHSVVEVAGNCIGERHLDRVVIVVPVVGRLALDLLMLAELQILRHGHKGQLLVAAAMVQVCKPHDASCLVSFLFSRANVRICRPVQFRVGLIGCWALRCETEPYEWTGEAESFTPRA